MKKLKIAFVRHSLLSRGGDKMIVSHASHLASRGHDVVIRTNLVDTVFLLDPRIRIEPLSFSGKTGTVLSALLEQHAVDVVIADIIPLICLLACRNRGKLLYFAQDYDESYYPCALQRYFIRFLYLIGLSLFRVRTVAVSHPLGDLLRRRFKGDVTVVENGIDTSVFYPDPVADLVRGKGGRRAILLLSRSDPRKGFDLGIAVLTGLASQIPADFEVWTVGESATGRFPGLIHHDFGYVDEHRLRQLMSSADLMLYPSRHEGFPLMVLEAFACRCPVVTTHAVPYAKHRENALVAGIGEVELLAELTAELVACAASRASLAEEGYRFALEHSLPQSLARFESRLQEREG